MLLPVDSPWKELLGGPLVGSGQGFRGFLAVGIDLAEHVVPFLQSRYGETSKGDARLSELRNVLYFTAVKLAPRIVVVVRKNEMLSPQLMQDGTGLFRKCFGARSLLCSLTEDAARVFPARPYYGGLTLFASS